MSVSVWDEERKRAMERFEKVLKNANKTIPDFKHIVKLTAMLLVNGVNRQEGYMELEIVSPEVIVEEG